MSILARSLRIVIAVVLFSVIGQSYAEKPAVTGDAEPPFLLPLPPVDKGNPKLDSRLNQLVSRVNSPKAMTAFAQQAGVDYAGDRVRVIVEALPGQVAAAEAVARGLGTLETQYNDLLQVILPVSQLNALAESQSIRLVRTPLQIFPDVVSQGVSVIGADSWHNANVTGTGVKIGIIDAGFYGYAALLGTELPSANVTTWWAPSIGNAGTSEHGTGIAEIIYDIAPGAHLYLANFASENQKFRAP